MKRISRTNAVYKILQSGGKFFTVTYQKKNGVKVTYNVKLSRRKSKHIDIDKIFGYLTIYNPHTKSFKRMDSRTLKQININKDKFKIKI